MANPEPTERVLHGVSSNSPLPPSVETAYYRKCIELKRRINDIEENNDTLRTRKARIERAVLKLRMERAMMLERIGKNMELNIDDSDRSTSPPRTPQEKPLRSKRGHRQKATPPPSATGAAGTAISPAAAPAPAAATPAAPAAATPAQPPYSEPINPDASANSINTQFHEQYPNPAQATPQVPAANPPLNGTPALPPIGSMSVTPAAATAAAAVPSPRGYAYDPTQEERRENGDSAPAAAPAAVPAQAQQNGQAGSDTEMLEADDPSAPAGAGGGFTAVNR